MKGSLSKPGNIWFCFIDIKSFLKSGIANDEVKNYAIVVYFMDEFVISFYKIAATNPLIFQ